MSDSQPSTSVASDAKLAVRTQLKAASKPKRAPQQSKNLRGRPTDPLPTRVSKTLAFLLRHGADKEGLAIRPDGYLLVDELLAHPSLKLNGVDLGQLRQIVESDAKSRYSLDELPRPAPSSAADAEADVGPSSTGESSRAGAAAGASVACYIRANQGHSLDLSGMEGGMRRVEVAEQAGLAVHGTYERHWQSIYESGLQKMTRQHIHLALDLPPASSSSSKPLSRVRNDGDGDDDVNEPTKTVSGIRPSADLYIYLDVSLLLNQAVPLFLSANDVLLSPGDPSTPGSIGRRFFLRAVRRSGEVLWTRSEDGGEA